MSDIPASLLIIDKNTPLGSGGYATVYDATYKGSKVAAKVFNYGSIVESARQRIRKESNYSEIYAHPNIIKTYGVSFSSNQNCIIYEKADMSLVHFLKMFQKYCSSSSNSSNSSISTTLQQIIEIYFQFCLHVLTQLLAAIQHLHSNDIIHCDLKPENILLFLPKNVDNTSIFSILQNFQYIRVVLTDFGSVIEVDDIKHPQTTKSITSTTVYAAPEVITLTNEQYDGMNTLRSVEIYNQLTNLFADVSTTRIDTLNNTSIQEYSTGTSSTSSVATRTRTAGTGGTSTSKQNQAVVSAATDIWSFGCIILVLCNLGYHPLTTQFSSSELLRALTLGRNTKNTNTNPEYLSSTSNANVEFYIDIQANCPQKLIILASFCLKENPTKRVSFREIEYHIHSFSKNGITIDFNPTFNKYFIVTLRSPSSSNKLERKIDKYFFDTKSQHTDVDITSDVNTIVSAANHLVTQRQAYEKSLTYHNNHTNNNYTTMRLQADREEEYSVIIDNIATLRRLILKNNYQQNDRISQVYTQLMTPSKTYDNSSPHLSDIDEDDVYYEIDNLTRDIQDFKLSNQSSSQSLNRNQGQVPRGTSIGKYSSSGSANGRELFEGPRGGVYSITDKGTRVYIKQPNSQTTTTTRTTTKTTETKPTTILSSPKKSPQSSYDSRGYSSDNYGSSRGYGNNSSSSNSNSNSSNTDRFGGTSTNSTYSSTGKANGSTIYRGPSGGEYIINSNNKKTYLSSLSSSSPSKPASSSSSSSSSSSRSSTYTPSYTSSYSSYSSTPSASTSTSTPSTGTYVSKGSANGSAIYTGPRGGTYRLSASGNKTYIK